MAEQTKRQQILSRWGQLKTERASWWQHWSEITQFITPRQGRYFAQDRNKGQRRHNNIYDSTGSRALNVLAAGLMGGLTSPARPWFRLATSDAKLNKQPAVKQWLNDVTDLMLTIFQKSNTYRALHSIYKELGAFGTGAAIITADFDNVIHVHPITIGEYAVAVNFQGRVDTLYREFQMTVGQLVKEFGLENVAPATKSMYDRGSLDAWITVLHAIEPRADRDPAMLDSKNMAWSDTYMELSATGEQFLRESGFNKFPAVCPRWDVEGGDIYGNSPGQEALGDIKQLQHEQLRKSQAIDLQVNPPLQVPTSYKNRDIERLPGGISFVDTAGSGKAIQTAFDVQLNLGELLADIQDVRGRINSAFFVDLFMMISQDNASTTRMTATEVTERHEEKMLMLGPVLERLQDELLDPLIEVTFQRMVESNILPPSPPEMQGQQLSVELVSMLAQAQRAIATNGIDRFTQSMGAVAQFKPEVLDKFDADRWAEEYSDALGVNPDLILPEDQVQALRAQRAKQQQAAAQQQQMAAASQTAKNLGQTPTTGGTAASDVMNLFSQGLGAQQGS
ncbi:portal protein [Herbaspirillum sp. RTI4]|uniref:portal protein n=1 Tax=Herbaspirillum sp. RTI4 TaxID=3048640 RepID=UPI002AB4C5E0|nr:portal protein [Herbaspirillum sp. RTI4]MDY7579363.1 portal protein [Herbaspirillum sp. RTI4]MEA9980277.1 portal protein [Herbaspirillum sp. RTI4]